MPLVVGIRARTMHCTSGSVSRSRGFLVPQPPDETDESTGTPRGCSLRGVTLPGVAGGVKAGDRREGGGRGPRLEAMGSSVVVGAVPLEEWDNGGDMGDSEKSACSSSCWLCACAGEMEES